MKCYHLAALKITILNDNLKRFRWISLTILGLKTLYLEKFTDVSWLFIVEQLSPDDLLLEVEKRKIRHGVKLVDYLDLPEKILASTCMIIASRMVSGSRDFWRAKGCSWVNWLGYDDDTLSAWIHVRLICLQNFGFSFFIVAILIPIFIYKLSSSWES